ncbi:hypothetical protein AV530_010708 [Patagioenas fasciata monilis]|uniref:Uncharacterized protein n=1 Tax=Patagioenas fasciata monilis TaxID=372326 RepID=A0A1V4K902_PATFA|nr:hypothetical protein AV530_010708 [Patagioenas fasciata monilis]
MPGNRLRMRSTARAGGRLPSPACLARGEARGQPGRRGAAVAGLNRNISLLFHEAVWKESKGLSVPDQKLPDKDTRQTTVNPQPVPLFCLEVGHEDTGQNIPNIGVGFTSSNLRHLQEGSKDIILQCSTRGIKIHGQVSSGAEDGEKNK